MESNYKSIEDIYRRIDTQVAYINPLGCILVNKVLESLVLEYDVLGFQPEQKRVLKKRYFEWCRENHPDKVTDIEETSLHVLKVYGQAFQKYDQEEFDDMWTFMGFSAVTFYGVDVRHLTLPQLSRLMRDSEVLIDIARKCIPSNLSIINDLKSDLKLMKRLIQSRNNGHCIDHIFDGNNTFPKEECEICFTEDKRENELVSKHQGEVNIVVISDDEQSIDQLEKPIDVLKSAERSHEKDLHLDSDKENENQPKPCFKTMLNAELESLDIKTLKAIAKSKDLDISSALEKKDVIRIIIDYDMNDPEAIRIKNHKKRMNPTKVSVPHKTFASCEIKVVESIPFDINGLSVYKLKFDPAPKRKMLSSVDGRNWGTWVSSSRKGFSGLRRVANCDGGYNCKNLHCDFLLSYGRVNCFHFTKIDGDVCCRNCKHICEKVTCDCKKIWEFDLNMLLVTVYHIGNHNCTAKPFTCPDNTKLKERFTKVRVSPQEATMDILLETFEKNLDDIDMVIDNLLDSQKTRNFKKKVVDELHAHGQSFEAVAELKVQLASQGKDKFFIYKVNDRKMNDSISYVFKTSKPLIELALAMDKGGTCLLSNEYAYFDGTFKRCPGYVTLACHVYVSVINTMVKLFTMETENESTDCIELCWNLFNSALSEYKGEVTKFNPVGWVMDEGIGLWNGLRNVYGKAAVESSVSCEWHFIQSYKKQAKRLGPSDGGDHFEYLANRLMIAVNENEYEEVVVKLEDFISQNDSKRSIICDWLGWWDQRRSHFSRAFKNPSAPTTNLSEVYNSKYRTVNELNLKLIDAAKRDIIRAMHFDRAYKKYGEGIQSCGTGPSSHQRRGKDFRNQKKRAREYAKEIGEEFDEFESSTKTKRASVDTNQGENKRLERKRGRSKRFLKSLEKMKKHKSNMKLVQVHQLSESAQKCSVMYFGRECAVVIGKKMSCSCPFFTSSKEKQLETCMHIIYVLVNYYKVNENDPIVQQVALTPIELKSLFDGIPNVEVLSDTPTCSSKLTYVEERAIFETKKDFVQKWEIAKLEFRKNAHCATCKATMPAGKIFTQVKAFYIPPNQNFAVERTFYFCASFSCAKTVPSSNITTPRKDTPFFILDNSIISEEELTLLRSRGFKITF